MEKVDGVSHLVIKKSADFIQNRKGNPIYTSVLLASLGRENREVRVRVTSIYFWERLLDRKFRYWNMAQLVRHPRFYDPQCGVIGGCAGSCVQCPSRSQKQTLNHQRNGFCSVDPTKYNT